MADPKWEDSEPIAIQPSVDGMTPKWEESEPISAELSPNSSPVTAATTGLAEGATLGFAPALGAAGKTAMDAITGISGPLAGRGLDDLVDEYNQERERLRKDFAEAAAKHHKINLAANMLGGGATLAMAGPAALTDKGLAATGAALGLGKSASEGADIPQTINNAVTSAGTTLVGGKAIQAVTPYVAKAFKPESYRQLAEYMAEKATGATAKQASRFQPGTGGQLLDQGIVGFGDSPGDIANKANAAMEKTGENLGNSINQLDKQGVKVDRNTVIQYIKDKISALSGDESQTGLVKKLQNEVENIQAQIPEAPTSSEIARAKFMGTPIEAAEGASEVPISQAERIKQGYQAKVNWKTPNPDVIENNANTTVQRAYRQASEEAATEANPEIADVFKAEKKQYGLLDPVVDAAEGRTLQLKQSPIGGLLDVASDIAGGAPMAIARRLGAPRIASSIAVTANKASKIGAWSADKLSTVLQSAPESFGKFAGVLQKAVNRGGASLGATDYLLQQTNAEYRAQRDSALGVKESED